MTPRSNTTVKGTRCLDAFLKFRGEFGVAGFDECPLAARPLPLRWAFSFDALSHFANITRHSDHVV
jgi:hypothetical protein